MTRRGVYRAIFSVLFDDPDYQRLSANARLVLLTLRLCAASGPAAIFRYYGSVVSEQTGLSVRQLEAAILELEHERWIERQEPVIWVRNGLRYEPSMTLANEKHSQSVIKALRVLPRLQIVLNFCDYYKIAYPFDRVSIPSRYPSESLSTETETDPETETERTTLSGSSPTTHDSVNGNNGAGLHSDARVVLDWLNLKTGNHYEPVESNLSMIEARLKEGRDRYRLCQMVSTKVAEWGTDEKMRKFLRPATLFNKTNCAQYIGQLPPLQEVPDDESDATLH